jgi:hypothetical protein
MEFAVKHKIPTVIVRILFGLLMFFSAAMMLFVLVLLFRTTQRGMIHEHVYTRMEQGYNGLEEPPSRATRALNRAEIENLEGRPLWNQWSPS